MCYQFNTAWQWSSGRSSLLIFSSQGSQQTLPAGGAEEEVLLLHHTSHPRIHARPPLLEMADKIGRKYVTTNGNDTYNHYRYFVCHHQSYSCNPSQVFLKFDRIQTFLCGGLLYYRQIPKQLLHDGTSYELLNKTALFFIRHQWISAIYISNISVWDISGEEHINFTFYLLTDLPSLFWCGSCDDEDVMLFSNAGVSMQPS